MSEFESAKKLFIEGLDLLSLEKYADAELKLRQALGLVPGRVSVITNLSAALLGQGKIAESKEYARQSLINDENNEQGWLNLGLCLEKEDHLGEALDCYDKALAINPDLVEAWSNRGNVLRELRRFDEALLSYDRALAISPDFSKAWHNRGNVLGELRCHDEALLSYDKALMIKPDFAEAWSSRGNMLGELKCYDEALSNYEKALKIRPDLAEAWSSRGNLFRTLKRYDEALFNYDKALAIKPDFAEAWANRGNLFREMERLEDALLDYDKALSLKPSIPYQLGDWAHIKMLLCDWEGLDEAFGRISRGLEQGERVCLPFPMLAMPASNALRKKCNEIFSKDRYPSPSSFVARSGRRQDGKIRLGYFSSDFRLHAVSFLTAGMFEAHDRSRFEVIGFNLHELTNDEMECRLARTFDEFLALSSLDSSRAIQLIRQKELDIAIDLNGYTGMARTEFFRQRIAPIQINYLGYPGTMGADFMDYIIGDELLIPEVCRDDYSEKVVYLPNSFQVNDSKRSIAPLFSKAEAGLPNEGFVFCCFNNSYKLTPELYDLWLRLLARIDGSVLWLIKKNDVQALRLKARAAAQGISGDRVIFGESIPYAQHLARYQLADLALDTMPFGGGTTTSDSLWAGVPVISCIGESFAGRMSASILHAVGLPELVTNTIDEYESLAYELANNAQRLFDLREKLAQHRETFPLFDTVLFTRHIEAAYTKMCEMNWAGMIPDHIRVEAPVI